MEQSKFRPIVTWVLCVLLTGFFLLSAFPKLTQQPELVQAFETWGYSTGFLTLTGVLEVVGAVLVLIPMLATYGAGILIAVMLGAIYTHLSTGIGSPIEAIVTLVLAAVVAWLRWRDALGLGGRRD